MRFVPLRLPGGPRGAAIAMLFLFATASACQTKLFDTPKFHEGQRLGGQEVSAATLNLGHDVYTLYCQTCHGEAGDGRGPTSAGMRPPPRDFRPAQFKFGGVPVGELPRDEALDHILVHGLAGTPMLAWDLPPQQRHAVLQYIKTFAERWREEEPGSPIEVPDDPWRGRSAEAIEVGKRIYHLAGVENDPEGNMKYVLAGCSNCHPSYITRAERVALSQRYLGAPPAAMADLEDMYRPSLKASEYNAGAYTVQILPIDFLFQPVKNGTELEGLYRTIAAGIAGAAMPSWQGIVSEEGLWALTHYVKSLAELRGTPAAIALREELMAQAPLPPHDEDITEASRRQTKPRAKPPGPRVSRP